MPAVVAVVITLALYAITLGGTHTYDDVYHAREDPRLSRPEYWRYFWTDQYCIDGVDRLYRPLTSMSYAVQCYTTGDAGWPFHLVNWLLAAGCAAVVAEFARRLAGWWPAMIAGLIFAVHPIHVEAIAGIVGRAELLCTLATVGGLTICLGPPLTGKRVVAILACFVVALLSKEQGIVFPFVAGMLACLRWRNRAEGAPPADARQRKLRLLLGMFMVYVLAGYLFFREAILPMGWDPSRLEWSVNPLIFSQGADRWLMPLVLLGRYTALLVWPRMLSLDYGGDVLGSQVRWNEPWIYLGAVIAIGAVVLLIRSVRRRDLPVAFALLAGGLYYGLVSNLSLIGTIMGERLMFLPSVFFSLLLGVWLTRVAILHVQARRVIAVGFVMALILGSVRTVTYAARFNDPFELYSVGLAEQPRSVLLHRVMFDQYAKKSRWIEARKIGESCLQVAPNFWRSYHLTATAEIELGNIARARQLLQYAKDHCDHPQLQFAWMDLEVRIEHLRDVPSTQPATAAKSLTGTNTNGEPSRSLAHHTSPSNPAQ